MEDFVPQEKCVFPWGTQQGDASAYFLSLVISRQGGVLGEGQKEPPWQCHPLRAQAHAVHPVWQPLPERRLVRSKRGTPRSEDLRGKRRQNIAVTNLC